MFIVEWIAAQTEPAPAMPQYAHRLSIAAAELTQHPLLKGVGSPYTSPMLRAVSAASAREDTLSLR